MKMDRRQLKEYPFDGVFYEYKDDKSDGLLNTKVEEVEVLRVKCDIQQTSQIGNAGFLASSYTIFFPLEDNTSLIVKEPTSELAKDEETDEEIGEDTYEETERNDDLQEETEEPVLPSQYDLIEDTSYKPIVVKRGMYFRGSIYGYEVNGKVTSIAPSMLGGCACQIKDLDE